MRIVQAYVYDVVVVWMEVKEKNERENSFSLWIKSWRLILYKISHIHFGQT